MKSRLHICVLAAVLGTLALSGCGSGKGKTEETDTRASIEHEIEDSAETSSIWEPSEKRFREKLRKMGCYEDTPYGTPSEAELEELGASYGCAGETLIDNGIDFHLKEHFFPSDTGISNVMGKLIKLIESQDENSKHCCSEKYENEYDAIVKFCILKTDSVYFEYFDYIEEKRLFGPNYSIIRSKSLPISLGQAKIGMTWEEFLNIPELNERCPDIKYRESEYIEFANTDEVYFFYFKEKVLREMIVDYIL